MSPVERRGLRLLGRGRNNIPVAPDGLASRSLRDRARGAALVAQAFLPDFTGPGAPHSIIEAIERHFSDREGLRVLDAGCGDKFHLAFKIPMHLVGIDASEHQLARNRALDESVVGDLDQVAIERQSFDLVVCWDVLEHLPKPLRTLDKLIEAVKPGGLLILAWPNVASAKAVLARALPYTAHLKVVEWLYPNASLDDDRGPFPTALHRSLMPDSVLSHCACRGLEPVEMVSYESEMQRKARAKVHITGWRWAAVQAAIRLLSSGKIDPLRTDLIALLRKQDGRSPAAVSALADRARFLPLRVDP